MSASKGRSMYGGSSRTRNLWFFLEYSASWWFMEASSGNVCCGKAFSQYYPSAIIQSSFGLCSLNFLILHQTTSNSLVVSVSSIPCHSQAVGHWKCYHRIIYIVVSPADAATQCVQYIIISLSILEHDHKDRSSPSMFKALSIHIYIYI